MQCFEILVLFACVIGVLTATVAEDQSQQKESVTVENGPDISNKNEEQSDSEELKVYTNAFSDEVANKINDSSSEVKIKIDDFSDEVDTNSSSKEIDTDTNDSSNEVDTKTTNSSEEIDDKTEDFQIGVETDSPTLVTVTDSVLPNKKVIGLNIGLYFVLEEMRRKLTFDGRVPPELVIKVLVLSSKIEEAGGEIIPANKNMMKVIPDFLPASIKDAMCSTA